MLHTAGLGTGKRVSADETPVGDGLHDRTLGRAHIRHNGARGRERQDLADQLWEHAHRRRYENGIGLSDGAGKRASAGGDRATFHGRLDNCAARRQSR